MRIIKFKAKTLKPKKTMKTEENKRMLALSYMVADLKAENMDLADRVQYLEEDYNKVVSLLHATENRKDKDPANKTLDELKQLRDHCDMLEKNIEELKRECIQTQMERNEAKTHAYQCDIVQEDLFKRIVRFEKSEFLKIGDDCYHRDSLQNGHRVKVGSELCRYCQHMIKEDVSGKKCVLCAYCYDDKKAKEELECKATDD